MNIYYISLYAVCLCLGDPNEPGIEPLTLRVLPSLLDPLAEQSDVIRGLEKYTNYNITVLCFTDPGDGKRSDPVSVRTKEDGKFYLSLNN